jgi:ribonuclease III
VQESGPDHMKSFRARVRVAGELHGDGRGGSKKEAEQEAASTAYTELLERSARPRPLARAEE